MSDKKRRHVIANVRRGINGYLPSWAIGENELQDAVNVDFYKSTLGNKRGGMTAIATTGMTMTGVVSSLFRHVPSTDETLAELWAVDDSGTPIINRMAGTTAFAAPTLKDNPTGNGWDFTAASINGMLGLAYKSAQGRMHFWDAATVRRGGLATPAAPTTANTGAGAAIAFDAAATLNYGGGTTFSHTCAAGATLLIVQTRCDAASVTAVTYNAVAMTQIATVNNGGTYQLWYLVNPTSGANTIAITGTGNVGGCSTSYKGTATTGVPDAFNSNAASLTLSVTSIADRCWAVFAAEDRSGALPAASTNFTIRASPSAATSMVLGDSNQVITPPGVFTMVATGGAGPSSMIASIAGGASAVSAILRYYRIRWTVQVGGITVRRSEPSASVSFTPSGAGTAVRVTQPTVAGEGETHWEVEGSTDGITFYRIATVAIGTTTYDDSAATSSYSSNTLSDLTGKYTVQKSYRFIAADQNRLLGLGSYTATDKQNRLEISAVIGSSDIGDAERVDTSQVNSIIDFDENDSGDVAGLLGPIVGSFFVFKTRQVHQLTPTGSTQQPYRTEAISKSIGALNPLAIARAEDAIGNAALYWMSHRGPYRWSLAGLEYIGRGVEDYIIGPTATMNLAATKVLTRVVYYTDKRQVYFWWATGAGNDPNQGWIYDVQSGGWSRIPTGDKWSNVRCAVMFANTLGAAMSRDLKPYVGQTGAAKQIWKTDTGTTDNGTTYQAYIVTKDYEPGGPGFYGEVGSATLLAKVATGVTLTLTTTADFGIQTSTGTALLTATGAETRVSVDLPGSELSGVSFVRHQLGDAAAIDNTWSLDRLIIPIGKHMARQA